MWRNFLLFWIEEHGIPNDLKMDLLRVLELIYSVSILYLICTSPYWAPSILQSEIVIYYNYTCNNIIITLIRIIYEHKIDVLQRDPNFFPQASGNTFMTSVVIALMFMSSP